MTSLQFPTKSQFSISPLPSGCVLMRELPVPLPPLDDLRQGAGGEAVDGAHHLEGRPDLVVLQWRTESIVSRISFFLKK